MISLYQTSIYILYKPFIFSFPNSCLITSAKPLIFSVAANNNKKFLFQSSRYIKTLLAQLYQTTGKALSFKCSETQ